MAETAHVALLQAEQVARETNTRRAPNGVAYASFGDTRLISSELDRMVQAVPRTVAAALRSNAYYFVPLAIGERRASEISHSRHETTMVAASYTPELGEQAICHRNVALGETEAVFISTRLLSDRFALSFEFFINVGHAFVDEAGVPAEFADLVWKQAEADTRGETSQDAWEHRSSALGGRASGAKVDEKARNAFLESAFSDAIAIYLLSLAVDFDYSELREREYPLLAPQALAERLRLVARLFPPNDGYEFSIRYRRRA